MIFGTLYFPSGIGNKILKTNYQERYQDQYEKKWKTLRRKIYVGKLGSGTKK